jgi:hypothetical protein
VLDPTHSDALRNLAEAEKGQGLLGEAQSHFNKLLAEHQDMVRARRVQVRRTFPPPPPSLPWSDSHCLCKYVCLVLGAAVDIDVVCHRDTMIRQGSCRWGRLAYYCRL